MKPSEIMKEGRRVRAEGREFRPTGPGTVVGWSDPFGPLVQTFAVRVDGDELGGPWWYFEEELSPMNEEVA